MSSSPHLTQLQLSRGGSPTIPNSPPSMSFMTTTASTPNHFVAEPSSSGSALTGSSLGSIPPPNAMPVMADVSSTSFPPSERSSTVASQSNVVSPTRGLPKPRWGVSTEEAPIPILPVVSPELANDSPRLQDDGPSTPFHLPFSKPLLVNPVFVIPVLLVSSSLLPSKLIKLLTATHLIVLTLGNFFTQRRAIAVRHARLSAPSGSVSPSQDLLPAVGSGSLKGIPVIPPVAILAMGDMIRSRLPPAKLFLIGMAIWVFVLTRNYLSSKHQEIASGKSAFGIPATVGGGSLYLLAFFISLIILYVDAYAAMCFLPFDRCQIGILVSFFECVWRIFRNIKQVFRN